MCWGLFYTLNKTDHVSLLMSEKVTFSYDLRKQNKAEANTLRSRAVVFPLVFQLVECLKVGTSLACS